MFIGRKNELEFLNDKYNENKAQLIVIYGRRRIGKTEILKEFCKDKHHFFYSCTQSTDSIQLKRFSAKLLKEKIPASEFVSEFDDWENAFLALKDLPFGNKKKLVVIDEFPYICQNNKSIPSILQNLWDSELKNENIMIILCGSAMSFIEKDLLSEKNPLYGRATGIFKVEELSFYDAIKFFPNYTDEDKILVYSILGGIPHYLNQFNPDFSIEQNIKKYILSKGSVLYNEVEFLLHQELREISVYNSIIEAVALGCTKLNDINQKALIQSTAKTSVYLKSLIELGIVKKDFSVDVHTKEKANSNRGIYKLTDNFFRFYYTFCFDNSSQLEDGDIDGIYQYYIKPNLNRYASLSFEDVCTLFLKKMQKSNRLPLRYSKIGRWSGKTTVRDNDADNSLRLAETEIDILAVSKDKKQYLVGECKYKNQPFSYSEYLDTKAKLSGEKDKAEFFYALFSKSGFDENILNEEKMNANLLVYTLSDIVNFKE